MKNKVFIDETFAKENKNKQRKKKQVYFISDKTK